MTPGRVCVVGSFMMDLVVRAPRRPGTGETVIGTDFEMFLGGKGFNQAVAAARAGSLTSMIGRLGNDDFGNQFRARLLAEGIDSTHVTTDDETGTGIGVPLVEESGENSIVVIARANAAVSPDDIHRAASLITAADVLLLQFELSVDVALAAARVAKDAGVTVILNPAPAPALARFEPFRGLVDVLAPNETEAHALVRSSAGLDHSELAQALAAYVQGAVVMTIGDGGCLATDAEAAFTLAAHPVEVVDTVGAGDAFCGALAAWLAAGASFHEAVVHANAAGALAVTRRGAEPSMPGFESIVQLLDMSEPSTPPDAGRRRRRVPPSSQAARGGLRRDRRSAQ
jgi:ribokinase